MPLAEITQFQWWTLGIALFGAATGLASLTWAVRQYFLTGHRVVVEATHGVTVDPAQLPLVLKPNITLRVMNRGRAAVTIREINVEQLEAERPRQIVWSDWVGNSGVLPWNFRLEPGSEGVWRIENPERLRGMLTQHPDERPLCRFVVAPATGKAVNSNEIRIHFEEVEGLEVRLVTADEIHAVDE